MITVAANPETDLRLAMAEVGIEVAGPLVLDGTLHRVDGEGDKRGSRSVWYIGFPDPPISGAFGCWRRFPGRTFKWTAAGEGWKDADPDQRAEWGRSIEAQRAQREAEEKAAAERAAARARRIWGAAGEVDPAHPYLERKGVAGCGIRQQGNALLIPVRDTAANLNGLQFIHPDGVKRFMAGMQKSGSYHAIGSLRHHLIVCEGYATGETIWRPTGAAVAVAFDAGNLAPVAVALHQKYPEVRIIIAADDDRFTTGNPGLKAAREAAELVGGVVVAPEFEGRETGTDFNDLAAIRGLSAVREAFSEALS